MHKGYLHITVLIIDCKIQLFLYNYPTPLCLRKKVLDQIALLKNDVDVQTVMRTNWTLELKYMYTSAQGSKGIRQWSIN